LGILFADSFEFDLTLNNNKRLSISEPTILAVAMNVFF
jgi:hypothetical protein